MMITTRFSQIFMFYILQIHHWLTQSPVGASLLAMVVNEYAGYLDNRVVLESIASRLAPTGSVCTLLYKRSIIVTLA
ncbi:hypothetical protein EMIT0196MI5_330026 [Pseudomonas sp. IT-196MI5]